MEQPATASRPRRRFGALRKIGCLTSLVVLLILAGFIYWRYYFTYSDGERNGLLQKFSHKGNLFKTYEGEIISNAVSGNLNMPIALEKFAFSVTDEALAKKINTLQGRHVVVHYQQKKSAAFWRGDSEYIVDSVRAE